MTFEVNDLGSNQLERNLCLRNQSGPAEEDGPLETRVPSTPGQPVRAEQSCSHNPAGTGNAKVTLHRGLKKLTRPGKRDIRCQKPGRGAGEGRAGVGWRRLLGAGSGGVGTVPRVPELPPGLMSSLLLPLADGPGQSQALCRGPRPERLEAVGPLSSRRPDSRQEALSQLARAPASLMLQLRGPAQ